MMPTVHKQLHNVIFVLGPPGCGKGTQGIRLEKTFRLKHLSAGELLRTEMSNPESQYGQLIDSHIKNGTIVPVEITCKLLENAMNSSPEIKNFLIDGFPRNRDNVDGWTREMGSKTRTVFVLYLSCPEEVCIKRCLARNEGRPDDNEQSLRKRIETYHTETMEIIEHFRGLNLLVEISAAGSPDEVFAEIEKVFIANEM